LIAKNVIDTFKFHKIIHNRMFTRFTRHNGNTICSFKNEPISCKFNGVRIRGNFSSDSHDLPLLNNYVHSSYILAEKLGRKKKLKYPLVIASKGIFYQLLTQLVIIF